MLIEAHGGQISVQSEAGCGATFTLTLPAEPNASSVRLPMQEALA
jgi:signal transduction histidine kinase